MKAKVTSISTAQQKEASEANWRSFANALSGPWGWTQTKLVWVEGAEHKEQPVTWRVTPSGAVAFFRAPQQSGLSLVLPYAKPATATSSTSRGSTLYHKGGYILEVGGSSSEISATDGTAPIAYGALVKVEIFFDYIVEG